MLAFILLPTPRHTVSTAAVCLVSGLRHLIMQWGRLQKCLKVPKKEADSNHRPTQACTCKKLDKTTRTEPPQQRQNMVDRDSFKKQKKTSRSSLVRVHRHNTFTQTSHAPKHKCNEFKHDWNRILEAHANGNEPGFMRRVCLHRKICNIKPWDAFISIKCTIWVFDYSIWHLSLRCEGASLWPANIWNRKHRCVSRVCCYAVDNFVKTQS